MTDIEKRIDEIASNVPSAWLDKAKCRKDCRHIIRKYQIQTLRVLNELDEARVEIERLRKIIEDEDVSDM